MDLNLNYSSLYCPFSVILFIHQKTVSLLQGNNNTGMAMIFTLVSEAQDFLSKIIERIKKYKEEEKEKVEIERLKEEEKKYHGTHVTVESFTKWRINFEKEMKEKLGKKVKEEIDAKKLTGKFLCDKSVNMSKRNIITQ